MGKKLIKLLGIISLFLVSLSSCYEDKIIDVNLLDEKDEISISNDSIEVQSDYVLFIIETDSTQTRLVPAATSIVGIKNLTTNTLLPTTKQPVTTKQPTNTNIVKTPENSIKQVETTQAVPTKDVSKGDQLLVTVKQTVTDPLGKIQEELADVTIVYDGQTIVHIPFVVEHYIEISEFFTNKLQKTLESNVYFKANGNKYIGFNLKNPVSLGDEDWKYLNSISNLTTIEFGNILNDKIPDRAFKGNKILRNVIFGTNTKKVGYESFAECENLIYFTLSNKITDLGSRAFYNDTKLIGDKKGNLEIPKSVTYIGDETFKNCGFLCELKVLGVINEVGSESFKNTKFRTGLSAIQNIRVIKSRAFENSTFEDDLVIGGYNSQIADLAFSNIKAKSITIKNNVTFNVDEDSYIFYSTECTKVNIGLLDSNELMLSENLNKIFHKGTLKTSLDEINFYGVVNEIPNFGSNATIGELHFYRDINLPDKGGPIQPENLLNNRYAIYIHDNVKVNSTLKNVIVYKNPNGSEYTSFWEKSIYFGNNVSFERNSLSVGNFKKIENIRGTNSYTKDFLSKNSGIREKVQVVINYDKESNFSDEMFKDNDPSNNITIKHGIVKYPIFKHKKFDQLVITEPITSTDMNYFDAFGHTYYSAIYLPYKNVNGVSKATTKKIHKKCFANNPNLKLIHGLENVEEIGEYAFANCPNISGLMLSNVKTINEFAIKGSGIKILDLRGSPLDGKIASYALAGSNLETINLINTKFPNIPSYCFADNPNLRNFIIGNVEKTDVGTTLYNQTKIKRIGSHAFDGCKVLDINVPNSVETIDDYAFANCTKLKINMFEGLKTIGPWCFWNCEELVYVNIPKSITSIGAGAFKTRSEAKKLNVTFNWTDKNDIIPYDDDVWLMGQLIMRVPKDGENERVRTMSGGMNRYLNLINTNKYFDKGYGKIGKKDRRADKAEINNWGSEFGIPEKTKQIQIQSQGIMLPMPGFDIVTNVISNGANGSYTISTYVPATIYLQPTIHEAEIVAAEAAAQAAALETTQANIAATAAANAAAQAVAETTATLHAASMSAFAAIGELNAYVAHTAAAAFSGVTGTLVYGNGVVAATSTMAASNAGILSAFGGATTTVSQSIAAAPSVLGSGAAAVGSSMSVPVIGAIIAVVVVAVILVVILSCWFTGKFDKHKTYSTGTFATVDGDLYLPSGEIIVGNDDNTLRLTNQKFDQLQENFDAHQKASDERAANEALTRSFRDYKQNLYPNVPPPIDFNPDKD